MSGLSKSFSLLIILILAVSSLIMVKPTFAQTIPKPAVPEFSVAVVDHSYTVPASTSIDPYTGQQITNPSYFVENKTIDITIKNQPFVPPDDLTNLFFNIRLKGHFETNWSELYHITNQTNDNTLLPQSGNEYTVHSIPQTFPSNGSVDFQVEAFIAVGHRFFNTNFGYWTWEESGWSPTQTITIADGVFSSSISTSPYPSLAPISASTPSPTPTLTPAPTPTPTITGSFMGNNATLLSAILIVAVIAIGAGLLIFFKKRKH